MNELRDKVLDFSGAVSVVVAIAVWISVGFLTGLYAYLSCLVGTLVLVRVFIGRRVL